MARKKAQRDAEDAAKATLQRASPTFVAYVSGAHPSEVSTAIAASDCPRNADGTLSWTEVRAWAQRRGRLGYAAPRAADAGDDHAAMLSRYRALEAKREYELRIGQLMPRADVEREVLAYVLAVKAALLAMPEQVAPQLANLDARAVEAALAERVAWICQQHHQGLVAIPESLERAIVQLVRQHVAAPAAPPSPPKPPPPTAARAKPKARR